MTKPLSKSAVRTTHFPFQGAGTILFLAFSCSCAGSGIPHGPDDLRQAETVDHRGEEGTAAECLTCAPMCEGKECGDDGCAGICGECPASMWCLWWVGVCGHLDKGVCSKHCGEGSFGVDCGTCPDGWTCAEDKGLCEPEDGSCDAVHPLGSCINGMVVRCVDGQLQYESCPWNECLEDDDGAECAIPACLPDCFARECGGDGCGSECGSCESGTVCHDTLGVCLPEQGCGDIPEYGACVQHVMASCAAGTLEVESCLDAGKVCLSGVCGVPAGCYYPWMPLACDGLPAYGACRHEHYFFCEESQLKVRHCEQVYSTSCGRTGLDQVGCLP